MSKRAELPGPGIERAGAYRTADGALHATKDAARLRNAELGIGKFALDALAHCPSADTACCGGQAIPELTTYLIANAATLLPLLKELLRKPASEPTEPAK